MDQVVATPGIDRVIAIAGPDRVIAVIAEQHPVGGHGNGLHMRRTQGRVAKDKLLDIPDRIGALRRNNGIDSAVPGDGDIADGRAETRLINVGTAVETVVVSAAGERVIAGAAKDRVVAGAAGDQVIVSAGIDRVITGTAKDRVVAGAGRDRIRPAPAGQPVTAGATGECRPGNGIQLRQTQGPVTEDKPFDIGDPVGALRRNDGVDISVPGDGFGNGDIAADDAETRLIIADTAVETVVVSAAGERVMAGAAKDRVMAGAGLDRVIADTAIDRVMASAGQDRITATIDSLVANDKRDPVIAGTAIDRVMASAGLDDETVIIRADQQPSSVKVSLDIISVEIARSTVNAR